MKARLGDQRDNGRYVRFEVPGDEPLIIDSEEDQMVAIWIAAGSRVRVRPEETMVIEAVDVRVPEVPTDNKTPEKAERQRLRQLLQQSRKEARTLRRERRRQRREPDPPPEVIE